MAKKTAAGARKGAGKGARKGAATAARTSARKAAGKATRKGAAAGARKGGKRTPWLGGTGADVLIDGYARKLTSFLKALADGKVEQKEVNDQEKRVAGLMKHVEPHLHGELHEKVTHLLCELSAYNIMQVLHAMHEARPRSAFHG
jgi:hypothetical protein